MKGLRCPIQEGEADHPAVKNCIKQLGPNRWLLGPSLICEQDILSNTWSTYFKSEDSVLEWSPLDPIGPIQLVRCILGYATWRIGDWAYLRTRPWNDKIGSEAATIEYVQKKAPSIPVPTVLAYYIDKIARRSYILISSLPGIDLNDAWKLLNHQQKIDVSIQVVEYIDILSGCTSEKLQTADEKWVNEPFLSLQMLSRSLQRGRPSSEINQEENLLWDLLDPDKSQEYEKIWGGGEDRFVFCHLNMGPTHIKIMVKDGKVNVTGISDWDSAGFVPREWICTKLIVSSGYNFDWVGEENNCDWAYTVWALLNAKRFPSYPEQWRNWTGVSD